jgi:hypothetical protein
MLKQLGCATTVVDARPIADPVVLLKRFKEIQVAILGKLVAPPDTYSILAPRILTFANALRQSGVKVLADFSDDGFQRSVRAPYFRGIANVADGVVASTDALADVLREETANPVFVITDPVEGHRGMPTLDVATITPDRPLRLLWYGHPTNLETLRLGVAQITQLANEIPVHMTIVTSRDSENDVRMIASNARFVPWTPTAVFAELRNCDVVFIPSDPATRRFAIKSPNRFTEAVWAGRFTVAHPVPSYENLAAYGWVGDDLGQGLAWMLSNPAAALERIRAGQACIEKEYTPEVVAERWKNTVLALV